MLSPQRIQGPLLPRVLALALGVIGLMIAIGSASVARADSPPATSACGIALSAPVLNKWTTLGGQTSRLGCPSSSNASTLRTPYGSSGEQAIFEGGTILWHASGPHAGQTYVVTGCFYRLYVQYGGPGGWLGLPVADAANTPDGQRQSFEGGHIVLERAANACSATRTAEEAPPPPAPDVAAAPKSPLDLFFDPARKDYFTTATQSGAQAAAAAHYDKVRTEGYVLTQRLPGTTPLKLFWNESRGDNMTVSSPEGEREALGSGYEFGGTQGFVYIDPAPGTKPLKLFRGPDGVDTLSTATPEGETDAAAKGYVFVRIEGYVLTSQ